MAVAAFVQSVIVLQKHARTEGLRKRSLYRRRDPSRRVTRSFIETAPPFCEAALMFRLKGSGKIAADRIESSLDLRRQALHRGNSTERDQRHNQRIFDQVLRLFPDDKIPDSKMKS
jgi:hypothetical protein